MPKKILDRREEQRGSIDSNILVIEACFDSTTRPVGQVVSYLNTLQYTAFEAATKCKENFGIGKKTRRQAERSSETVERCCASNAEGSDKDGAKNAEALPRRGTSC